MTGIRTRVRAGSAPLRAALASLALLVCGGCFRDPVVDRITLRFAADGSATATIVTTLDPDPDRGAGEEQVRAYRERIGRGDDPWLGSIADAAPDLEAHIVRKAKGEVVQVARRLTFSDPSRIGEIFSGDAVRATLAADGPRRTLTLVRAGSLASAEASRRVARARGEILRFFRRYLETTGDLYRWAEAHPERRAAVLGAVLGDLLTEEDQAHVKELAAVAGAEERRLMETAEEAAGALGDFLWEDEDDRRLALEYESRRVYSPLGGSLDVIVHGEVVRVEGFRDPLHGASADPARRSRGAGEPRHFVLPDVSFVGAIDAAASDVVAPLPLPLLVAFTAAEDPTGASEPSRLTLDDVLEWGILARPVPADLEERFDRALRGADTYLVEWMLPVRADDDDSGDDESGDDAGATSGAGEPEGAGPAGE